MKKKCYLVLAMSFLFFKGISAQETETTVQPVADDNTTFWVSPETNNEKVLNPNKFWDNWFMTVNAGTFMSFGDNLGSASFGKQFQPAVDQYYRHYKP